MREDNLLAVPPRAFVVATDSHHQLEVYLNVASRMKLTGINQPWVADITYIRLHREFVYLAVILDSFSQGGWLGVGPNAGNPATVGSAGVRDCGAQATARSGAPLRPRRAVCV